MSGLLSPLSSWLVDRRIRLSCAVVLAMLTSCDDEKKTHNEAAEQPNVVHAFAVDGAGVDLAADGQLLVVSARGSGFHLFSTAQPQRPLALAVVDAPYAYKALVQGTSVFALDETQGLSFLNTKSLSQLSLTQALSSPEIYGFVGDGAWVGSSVFLATESVGLSRYRVTPEFGLTGGRISSTASGPAASGLAVSGERIVTSSFRGDLNVYTWNGAPETNPVLVSSLPVDHQITSLDCNEVHCFAAALRDGLVVYAFGERNQPTEVFRYKTPDAVQQTLIDGEFLLTSFVNARGHNGFYLFTLEGDGSVVLRKRITTASDVKDFEVIGNYIYVLLANGTINIYERSSL